jgi:hypothetical protein
VNEEWISVNDAAKELNVDKRTIQLRIKGRSWPPLESKIVGGRQCVRAVDVYAHFRKYGRRPPAGLRRPPGDQLQPEGLKLPELPPDAPTEIIELLRRAADPLMRKALSPDEIRAYAAVAGVLQRIKESEAKSTGKLDPEEAIEMLQGLRDVYVDQVEAHASELADEVMRVARDLGNVDLQQLNPASRQVIENKVRENGNTVLVAVEAYVLEQIRGQRQIDFAGACNGVTDVTAASPS